MVTKAEKRLRAPTSAGGTVTCAIGDMARFDERPLSLDLAGSEGVPVVVAVTMRPGFDGLGRVPDEVLRSARVIVYATDLATERVCDFRFQEELAYYPRLSDVDRWAVERTRPPKSKEDEPSYLKPSSSPSSPPARGPASPTAEGGSPAGEPPRGSVGTVAAARHMEPPAPVAVMQFAALTGRLRVALFASTPLLQVSVVFRIGNHVPEGVDASEDFFSPWRVARMYNVTRENFALVVRWLRANRTALILRTASLELAATGETLLHALCGACGDPRLAQLLIVSCSRFLTVGHQARDGSTALHRLLALPGVCNPRDPRYHRCMALVDLLVTRAAAPLDRQDEDGQTVLHLACRGHRLDSRVLPTLLEAGGGLFLGIRDNDGRTPLQVANDPASGLLPSESAQAERLLQQPVRSLALRTLPVNDSLPPVDADDEFGAPRGARCLPEAMETLAADDADADAGAEGGVRRLTMQKSTTLASSSVSAAPRRTGAPRLSKASLEAEFRSLDANGNGWLSTAELRRAYRRYDHYGVVTTDSEMDALVDSLGIAADGRVTFDEFVLLVLKMSAR